MVEIIKAWRTSIGVFIDAHEANRKINRPHIDHGDRGLGPKTREEPKPVHLLLWTEDDGLDYEYFELKSIAPIDQNYLR
jgi:hypothetical protein